jgi:hypothetical protein
MNIDQMKEVKKAMDEINKRFCIGVETTAKENLVALFDSVTGFAFGPVFTSEEDAEDFMQFFKEMYPGTDIRTFAPQYLVSFTTEWSNQRRKFA